MWACNDLLRAGQSWDQISVGAIFSAPVSETRQDPFTMRLFRGGKEAGAWR